MKAEIDVADLQRLVKQAGLGVDKKSPNQAFHSLTLRARGSTIVASGAQPNIDVVSSAYGTVHTEGTVAVSHGVFAAAVDRLVSGTVKLELKDNALLMRIKSGRYRFRTLDIDTMSRPPGAMKSKFEVPRGLLLDVIKECSHSMPHDGDLREFLRGTRIRISDGYLHAWAMNGRQISIAKEPLDVKFDLNVFVTKHGIGVVSSILSTLDADTIRIGLDDRILLEAPGIAAYIRLGSLKGTIDPEKFVAVPKVQAKVERESLLDALKRVSLFATRAVTLRIQADSVALEAEGSEGKASEQIKASEGSDLTLTLEPKPLIESLQAMSTKYIRIGADSEKDLFTMRSNRSTHGVMPLYGAA